MSKKINKILSNILKIAIFEKKTYKKIKKMFQYKIKILFL